MAAIHIDHLPDLPVDAGAVNFPGTLWAFEWNAPHPHWCPDEHPLPVVPPRLRRRWFGLQWWVKPAGLDFLLKLACRLIEALSNPHLIGFLDYFSKLFRKKTFPIN